MFLFSPTFRFVLNCLRQFNDPYTCTSRLPPPPHTHTLLQYGIYIHYFYEPEIPEWTQNVTTKPNSPGFYGPAV